MQRYSRQDILINSIKKTEKNASDIFSDKKLVVIGCGGIGSVLCELLIRGGFRNLTIIDNDIIDETNLQRQIFFEEDIGTPKSKTLEKYLKKIDKKANINSILDVIDENNIEKYCINCDLIIDATDNFKTRKIINNFSIENKKDWQYNGAVKNSITTCIFYWKNNLFEKIFPKEVKDVKCCDVGVLSSTTFASASISFNEIIKYFLNIEENNMIRYNIWNHRVDKIKLK